VIFNPALANAQGLGQMVRFDQRREPYFLSHGGPIGYRQQLLVAPHGLGTGEDALAVERALDALVIVSHFERAEIELAHVRGLQRVFAAALAALERLHESKMIVHTLSQ